MMNSSPEAPWYRKTLPPWFPVWLVIAMFLAITCGYLATWVQDFSGWTVFAGCGLGFFAGLVFSMLIAGRAPHAPSTSPCTADYLRPPAWLAMPVSAAFMMFLAYHLIDETIEKGYVVSSRRGGMGGGSVHIPGPLAAMFACCFLVGAGVWNVKAIQRRRESVSIYIGTILASGVLLVAYGLVLARVWAYLSEPTAPPKQAAIQVSWRFPGESVGHDRLI